MSSAGETWFGSTFLAHCYHRGITLDQQKRKIDRLASFGCAKLRTVDGVWYSVEGRRRKFNALTGQWRSLKRGDPLLALEVAHD